MASVALPLEPQYQQRQRYITSTPARARARACACTHRNPARNDQPSPNRGCPIMQRHGTFSTPGGKPFRRLFQRERQLPQPWSPAKSKSPTLLLDCTHIPCPPFYRDSNIGPFPACLFASAKLSERPIPPFQQHDTTPLTGAAAATAAATSAAMPTMWLTDAQSMLHVSQGDSLPLKLSPN